MRAIWSCCLFAALLAAAPSHAERPYVAIEERLTAEQLRETGLDQLSAQQLQRLNALLREEGEVQRAVVRQELARAAPADPDRREAIISKLVGDFSGWSGSTVFRLENGQAWRVVDTADYYLPKSKARSGLTAVVLPGSFGSWFLQIEGHPVRAKVKPAAR